MIDIGKIIKRAWQILWSYRILWVFGILLAITAGGSGGYNGGGSSNYQTDGNNPPQIPTQSSDPNVRQMNQWFQQNLEPIFAHPEQHVATFVWLGIAVFLFIVVVSLLFAMVRYPTETAVIRMVDMYEQTGEKVGFRQGWKLGWNRRAFRMWLIDLVTGLPVLLLMAVLAGLGVLIYFSVRGGSEAAIASSVIATVGCAFLFIFVCIVLAVALSLLRQFFIRYAALENAGVADSFRGGWNMFKRNWKSALLMWVVMLGIGIAAGIAMMIVFFLLIPTYIVMMLPAVFVAIVPGLVVFGITSIFASGPLAWLLGILAALPFFFMVVFTPLMFVNGWYMIFDYNIWTLTYREIKALESVTPLNALDTPVTPA